MLFSFNIVQRTLPSLWSGQVCPPLLSYNPMLLPPSSLKFLDEIVEGLKLMDSERRQACSIFSRSLSVQPQPLDPDPS